MLGWAQSGFHKNRTETSYNTLVFLHPVLMADHEVHSGAFRARNVNELFFMLGWAQSGFHQKHAGTHYVQLVFLHPIGSAGHVVHYGASRA
jgi:hypothetical protein